MTARLAGIAARAGVSEATVSRVLNGRPGVATDTRRAVLAALDALGYPHPARERRQGGALIGLVMPELDNPVFPALAQAIGAALAGRGCTPVLATQGQEGSAEDELTDMLVERGATGLIVVSGRHADTTADLGGYERLRARGVPFVLVDGYAPTVRAPFVSPDDRAAVRLAVTHLVALGHRRVGLAVGPARFVPVIRKTGAFVEAVGELLGQPEEEAEKLIGRSLFTLEGGQAAASALLDAGCTALVCASDMMALGAIRAVRQRGLEVPRDVSVVGYDDSPLMAFTDPPLTTIRKPVAAMGRAAVHTLLEEIAGSPPPHSEFVFLPELVVRGSTASGPPRSAS
ncbi:LacI family DNA-binding transcriptional regulator [Streptomyces sp. 8L]|uniref:LacI family DNA-binding transcriptional regulator n=1 Tax=Streptomyces sp. 8L TaxID=2877242 RepID=UPI001CD714A5|nr:LacI family DNA-binding transcriptional regulator [Streptomyces sp. 8L]MCA1219957.1 LacI family transcriptional regulator [Streptomyces sp. 8L]